MNENIFIAFDSRKIAVSIAKILIENGNNVVSISKSFAELMQSLSYYHGGIVITGCVFAKKRTDRIAENVSDDFSFIVLGNKMQLDIITGERVFKLCYPLQKNDLICSVDMLLSMDNQYKPSVHKDENDEKIILKAKCVLIDMYSMTEEEAHRYMQKKSMDTGRKMADIARIILNT